MLPHWNAKAGTYFDLCKIFNRIGFVGFEADAAVSRGANAAGAEPCRLSRRSKCRPDAAIPEASGRRYALGRSLAKTAGLRKDRHRRYQHRFVRRLFCVYARHARSTRQSLITCPATRRMSSGTASRPITSKESLGDNLTLDELREYWLPISPMAYIDRLAKLPPRPAALHLHPLRPQLPGRSLSRHDQGPPPPQNKTQRSRHPLRPLHARRKTVGLLRRV